MHISHQINHKLMHKQIALNEKNIYFFRLPRLTFDLMKGRVGNWEMEKILKGWWADEQMGRLAPSGGLSLEYSRRDRCAKLLVSSTLLANWIRKRPTRKQCSVSLTPTNLPLALYLRVPPFLMGKINVNFYAWFMASHLFFCLGRGGRWRSEPF